MSDVATNPKIEYNEMLPLGKSNSYFSHWPLCISLRILRVVLSFMYQSAVEFS